MSAPSPANAVITKPFDLRPEAKAVGNDESEIANLRNVDPRIIHFVDNAESEREPNARGTKRTAHDVLGAAGPSRCDAWTARRMSLRFAAQITHAPSSCPEVDAPCKSISVL